jgi:hypothetical protein
MTDLRHTLPDALSLVPRLPRSRAGLAGRLRALSAARLAVAIFLGGSAPPITTDIGAARPRQRPPVATDGAVAA